MKNNCTATTLNDAFNREISMLLRFLHGGTGIHDPADEPVHQIPLLEIADKLSDLRLLAERIDPGRRAESSFRNVASSNGSAESEDFGGECGA